jgi:hypothetical protein
MFLICLIVSHKYTTQTPLLQLFNTLSYPELRLVMKSFVKIILFVAIFLLNITPIFAQVPREKPIRIIVVPDHTDWTYNLGEKVKFTVTVLKNGSIVPNANVQYEIGLEKMTPTIKDSMTLANG